MSFSPHKRHYSGGEEYIPRKKQRVVLYLDDDTPIRTIEVTNFGDEVCSGYLRGYFDGKIGPVSEARIVNRESGAKDQLRIGYVTFLLPEDAAKLICEPDSQLECKFTIKQAKGVHQPKIDPNALKFQELNYDCFIHIASYLNLIDIVNLGKGGKASRRLQSFVQQIYEKRTHFSFGALSATDLSINNKNLPAILEESGSYIRSIRWRHINGKQLDLLAQYCQQVTDLKLMRPNLHLDAIERNQLLFKNLESLRIENADSFDAQIKGMIVSASKLKTLELISCYNVTGNFLFEWQNPQLECLKIWRCAGISPSSVSHFAVRADKLTKYSSDVYDSFIDCLTLPAKCLRNYTELDLAVNSSTDEKLELLKYDELNQLRKIHLKCLVFHERLSFDVTIAHNYNKTFAAMSSIPSLNSVTAEQIIIDQDTFKCLQSFANLRELTLNGVKTRIGEEMFVLITAYLPKLTKLSINLDNSTGETDFSSFGTIMLRRMVDLTYFSHSSMTWKSLEAIRQDRLLRTSSPIEIGISKEMFDDARKKDFAAMSKGLIYLSSIE